MVAFSTTWHETWTRNKNNMEGSVWGTSPRVPCRRLEGGGSSVLAFLARHSERQELFRKHRLYLIETGRRTDGRPAFVDSCK